MLDAYFLQKELPSKPAKRWVIGLSGGLDSTALLHLCVSYRQHIQPDLELLAIHVNHQISDASLEWQHHCQSLCDKWGVECFTESVIIEQRGRKSLEQVARDKRYQIFERVCVGSDLLLLAHHLDDQVETLLYRLVRGSGALGLRGMDAYFERNGLSIWRPLLAVSRRDLETYISRQELAWVEDPSNRDISFDRNFIRQEVLPLLASRWPSARKTLGRSARLLKESAELANNLAEIDLEHCQQNEQLIIAALQKLSVMRQKNCLRFWLQGKGAMLPSEKVLAQVIDCIHHYHEELNADISWSGDFGGNGQMRWQIHTFRGTLIAEPASKALDIAWSGRLTFGERLELPAGLGQLSFGVPDSPETNGGEPVQIADSLSAEPLRVAFRQGGEHFRPAGRKQKLLKKWFQDWGVPPWKRDRIPLICSGDKLVAVMGQAVAEGCQPRDGESGQIIQWSK